jgi:hypothetical protein
MEVVIYCAWENLHEWVGATVKVGNMEENLILMFKIILK